MDTREYCRMQVERARDHAAKHIDHMLDELEEDHRHLTQSEVRELKDLMWVIHTGHEIMMK